MSDQDIKAALEKIAKQYPEGCVAYYEQCKPNSWQAAFDKLEHALMSDNQRLRSNTLVWFEREVSRLMDHYRKLKIKMDAVYGR